MSCFFGNNFFWAIEPAQKLHGTLDPPAAHFFCYQYDLKKQCYMPVFAPYSRFSAILGRFFGDYFFWAIEPAQNLHGTLDPPAAHFFCCQYDLKKQRYMPVFAPYSQFSAILGRFFGDYFFWPIE